MTTVLDDAENRLGPAVVTAQTVRQERIESMREEIGRANRELATLKLAELEAFINTDIRPFLARVSSIGQRAQQPLPQHIQDYGKEMFMLCDIVPNAVRTGISAWDTLAPPIWTDGKSIDLNARAQTIHRFDPNCEIGIEREVDSATCEPTWKTMLVKAAGRLCSQVRSRWRRKP